MLEFFAVGFKVGLRGSGFRALFFIVFLLIGAACLAASFSGRQPLTVGLDVGLSGLRFMLLLMTLIWVQNLLARDIERKTLYFMLAYPYSRAQFLLARYCSVAFLALPVTLCSGAVLALALLWLGSGYEQATPPAFDWKYLLALLGVWLDLLVVAAFAFLLCTLSTTPFMPLLMGFAFAMAARGLGPTFDYLRQEAAEGSDKGEFYRLVLDYSYIWLPDLSRLDWRAFALYDLPVDMGAVVGSVTMVLAYIGALLCLAVLVFQRRDFT